MLTLSRTGGICGKIKERAEDFVVREITECGETLELDRAYEPGMLSLPSTDGKFAVLVLQKRLWNTSDALVRIAKMLGRGRKSVGYAGSKDRHSISVQLASIFGVKPEEVMRISLRDIRINGAWSSAEGIKMGGLLGNNFSIQINGTRGEERIEGILEELNGVFPNYFDKQRFGARSNNAKVGMHILRGDFESAVIEFLTSSEGETNNEARDARRRLAEEMDFGKALEYFPRHLVHERSMLSYLSRFSGNYANAIRSIPRGISLLFIHAVEAEIFNKALECGIGMLDEAKLHCDANFYGFPDISTSRNSLGEFPVGNLIGYDTNEGSISDCERDALEELGIGKAQFKIKSMPELSMRGTYRPLLVPFKHFSYARNESGVRMSFSIPNGAYATVLLNEFMKKGCE